VETVVNKWTVFIYILQASIQTITSTEVFKIIVFLNFKAGLFIDNILKSNGQATGYNLYMPMKDPVKNNCTDKANWDQCTDEMVYLTRFTGTIQ